MLLVFELGELVLVLCLFSIQTLDISYPNLDYLDMKFLLLAYYFHFLIFLFNFIQSDSYFILSLSDNNFFIRIYVSSRDILEVDI